MGSLVVGNRMAFFSDALAHCAFAGVGLGLLLCVLAGHPTMNSSAQRITLIMVAFGVSIGLLIAFVREQTGLASDTVIGVFYAGSIGFGAVVTQLVAAADGSSTSRISSSATRSRSRGWQVVLLLGLAVRHRRFPGRDVQLAGAGQRQSEPGPVAARAGAAVAAICSSCCWRLMVNLSQQITGTLLINGLLIVPAAAGGEPRQQSAADVLVLDRHRHVVGLGGHLLSWEIGNRFPKFSIGISGAIIVLSVILFVASVPLGRWLRRV